MPEMPEVESVAASIRGFVEGRVITAAELIKPDVIKYPDGEKYAGILKGKTIKSVKRRGKYIILELSGGILAVVHLRMTGKLLFTQKGQPIDKYACVVFHLDDENSLVYADVRRLGTLEAVTKEELPRIKGLCALGAEPLSAEFTEKYLADRLRRSRSRIKSFLLDQKNIAGLGNIYADESLAISRIHPMRQACSLSEGEIKALHAAVNKVIKEAIKDGGTSFRDYRNGLGQKGAHQDKLYAYNRKGQPCRFCGTGIVKTVVGGRGTYYCPSCQKLTPEKELKQN